MKENTNGLLNNLLSGFDKNGWRASIVGVERLDDLRNGIETLHSNGTLDGVIYKYLSGLNYDIPKDMPGAKSLITIAISDPRVRFRFTYGGRETSCVVRGTY
ncbi:MAG: hypothetical protein GY771_12120, partial [bacterium]|nr:hypothetical protein [bacterium]